MVKIEAWLGEYSKHLVVCSDTSTVRVRSHGKNRCDLCVRCTRCVWRRYCVAWRDTQNDCSDTCRFPVGPPSCTCACKYFIYLFLLRPLTLTHYENNAARRFLLIIRRRGKYRIFLFIDGAGRRRRGVRARTRARDGGGRCGWRRMMGGEGWGERLADKKNSMGRRGWFRGSAANHSKHERKLGAKLTLRSWIVAKGI